MDSETNSILIEDSDDSLLDFKELNDLEYDIPPVAPPTLESVLWDLESEEGSDSTSLHSLHSLTQKSKSMLYHGILQGISSQVASAGERVSAGLPTVISNSVKFVAVGTSHGFALAFDSEQKLCWCCHDLSTNDQGAISALAFNLDSTRLLVGYERGYISMIDTNSGDVIRRLPDAHAPQSAVLHLRFTSLNGLALSGDSAGCVFSLTFNRRLGVRTWDSKCLFSGARGEVCVFEPLVQDHHLQLLGHHILVAMATLSKVIVIAIRPRLKILFTQQLPRVATTLPLLSWQIVSVGKVLQPVLAWGRSNELNYTRVLAGLNGNKLRLSQLRSVRLSYTLSTIHWIGSRHLVTIDTSENLRLIEVRTQRELEVIDITSAGLVYSSAHFKALALGGGVSEAFALAGERACYSSIVSRGDQLLVLGTKNVQIVKLRTWSERLNYLSDQGRWAEALNLAAEENMHRDKAAMVLLEKFLINLIQNGVDRDSLTAAVNCCVKLNKIDLLCNDLWDAVALDQYTLEWYYTLLIDHISDGSLYFLNPSVAQALVTYLHQKSPTLLENVLLSIDLSCLDLHQVLGICRKNKLYDSWIHITTKTMGDYVSPLTEFIGELTPDNHKLGNTLLVYVSACLSGLGYPHGKIPDRDVQRIKHDVLRCLETVHTVHAVENEQNFPYLRALLKYNTRECLNVVEIAFREVEFSGEMGLLQRQRLVQILLQIVTPPEFSDSEVIILACFISRLITSANLSADEEILNTVVQSLTNAGDKLSLRDHSEREQAWIDLLNGQKMGHLDLDAQLQTALDAKCYKVVECIYEKQGKFANILECYLNDKVRHVEVFSYIRKYISDEERCIRQQFMANFKTLVDVDSKRTADVVIENYSKLAEQLCCILETDSELLYKFLSQIIYTDVKLSPKTTEEYLRLLCMKNPSAVYSYVKLNLCRVEEALKITQKYQMHSSVAWLLEQSGDFEQALNLLLRHNMIDSALEVCIRGSEHLDAKETQKLWLELLKHPTVVENISMRELLHSAAPHVPPAQLLELVTDANLGDIKVLVEGMLSDCEHDIQLLNSTFKILSCDLHHGKL
uniref:Vacuolar protein sorting-associated protein 8 central domain-containing protein n=2 Tax=Photinus pyralis TaxID=7054 RepID=A0A1Y1MXN6_PHOPY